MPRPLLAPASSTVPEATRERLHRSLRPPSRRISLGLGEVGEFRDLLVTLALRDVKLRYRQTALGVLWVVLQPLIAAGIFTFVFGHIAGLGSDGIPYFCFAFAGQIAWNAFASTLGKSSVSLVQNASLVSKVFFPRLVLPFSTVLSSLIDFTVGMIALLFLMVIQGVAPGWGVLLLPMWLTLLVLLGLGVGLFAGALMVRYRDVGFVLPVAVQFLLYASPVGWPLSELVARYGASKAHLYLLLNPTAALLEAFRGSLFGRANIPWTYVASAAGITVLVLFAGMVLFRDQERRFADVI